MHATSNLVLFEIGRRGKHIDIGARLPRSQRSTAGPNKAGSDESGGQAERGTGGADA